MPAIPGYRDLAQDEEHNGGAPRVAATGVRVYTIWHAYISGDSPSEITDSHAGLTLGSVFSALAFAADHRDELDQYEAEEIESNRQLLEQYTPLALEKRINERATVLF